MARKNKYKKGLSKSFFSSFLILLAALTIVAALILAVLGINKSRDLRSKASGENQYVLNPRLRFGTSFAGVTKNPDGSQTSRSVDEMQWRELGVSWYLDWDYRGGPREGLEYLGLIGAYGEQYSEARCDRLKEEIRKNPQKFPDRMIWAIGNEIFYQPQSDPFTPATYPAHYKAFYDCLKSINPTFRVSPGAIVGTKEYFKQFGKYNEELYREMLTNYQNQFGTNMPIDIFVSHAYLMNYDNEADPNNFKEEVRRQRQIMKDYGWQDKELWIAEFGVLRPGSGEQVTLSRFMDGTIRYLMTDEQKDLSLGNPQDDFRLVQRFAWFILNEDKGGVWYYAHSALAETNTGQLTPLGLKYKQLIESYSGVSNPPNLPPTVAPPAACPAQCNYIERNPATIANYCQGHGVICNPPKTYATNLSCHAGQGSNACRWTNYGPNCQLPNCTGCACVAPSPTSLSFPLNRSSSQSSLSLILDQSRTVTYTPQKISGIWQNIFTFSPTKAGKLDKVELCVSGQGTLNLQLNTGDKSATITVNYQDPKNASLCRWFSFNFSNKPSLNPAINYSFTFTATGNLNVHRGTISGGGWNNAWARKIWLLVI